MVSDDKTDKEAQLRLAQTALSDTTKQLEQVGVLCSSYKLPLTYTVPILTLSHYAENPA